VAKQLESHKFNTAISGLHKLTNALLAFSESHPTLVNSKVFVSGIGDLVTMLEPFAPHLSAELRTQLAPQLTLIRGIEESSSSPTPHVSGVLWPAVDEKDTAAVEEVHGYVVRVMFNGKEAGHVTLPQTAEELGSLDPLRAALEGNEEFNALIQGKTLKKMIHIKRREANLTWVNCIV